MTLEEYLNLIPSENREKPNFIAALSIGVGFQAYLQELLLSMIPIFDLDTGVGDQLDIIGEWAGISRNVAIPISGVYFSWDGSDYTVGWDYGTWQPSSAPTQVTVLPDDAYRTVIKAKIAANHWDGTINGAYTIWEALFTEFTILIQDNLNMTYDLAVVGGIVDSLTLALLTEGYISLRPEGVRLNEIFVATSTDPSFAWDVESDLLKGWDEGFWLREITPT